MNYVETLHRQIEAMLKGFVQNVPNLTISLLVLIATWLLAKFAVRIADRLTKNTHIRENLKQLVETTVRLAIWVIGLMIAATISMPGLTPASLFAGLGVGALAIGFAFQDIFENFLAGVLIMVRDRMRIGDNIECQSITGKVERITLRESHIRAPSNELTIVPNSVLFKNPVRITTDAPSRRFQITVSIVTDYDLDKAVEVIRGAVEAQGDVDKSHPVDVFAREFSSSAVDLLVRWWCGQRAKDFALQDQIVRAIKRALDDAGIKVSGAQTTTIELENPAELVLSSPEAVQKEAEPA
jgi:small conductance mechanosensitive channel